MRKKYWQQSRYTFFLVSFILFAFVGKRIRNPIAGWAMDLSVPCIVEGRSELRNAGRVNCKIHWPFSGCGTPYLLNVFDTLQLPFLGIAVRLVECSLQSTDLASSVSRKMLNPQILNVTTFFAVCCCLFKRTLPYLAFKRSSVFAGIRLCALRCYVQLIQHSYFFHFSGE